MRGSRVCAASATNTRCAGLGDRRLVRDGHWSWSRRRCRAGSRRVSVPSYVLDTTGIVRWINPAAERLLGDVRGRHFTSVVAPEDSPGARESILSEGARYRAGQPRRPAVLVSTAGTRVDVELSAVPLKNGERVVGVFGQIEGRPADTSISATPASHPSPGRGAAAAGTGPLDEADRRRAPSQHRDGEEPCSPSLSGSRRPLETRGCRCGTGRHDRLIEERGRPSGALSALWADGGDEHRWV